jgi:hypothetical protein
MKIADCPEGILKVVEQSEAKDEIECPKPPQRRILRISNSKINAGMAVTCFLDVFHSPIHGGDLQSRISQHRGEISDAASKIQCGIHPKF